jgi:hypothetical protein
LSTTASVKTISRENINNLRLAEVNREWSILNAP